jgi:hypothetical protein
VITVEVVTVAPVAPLETDSGLIVVASADAMPMARNDAESTRLKASRIRRLRPR